MEALRTVPPAERAFAYGRVHAAFERVFHGGQNTHAQDELKALNLLFYNRLRGIP